MTAEDREPELVEPDPPTLMRLRPLLGPAAAGRLVHAASDVKRPGLPVDVGPSKRAQLATARSGQSGEQQEVRKRRFDRLGDLNDALNLAGARGGDLGTVNWWGSCSVGDVAIHEVPPFSLVE